MHPTTAATAIPTAPIINWLNNINKNGLFFSSFLVLLVLELFVSLELIAELGLVVLAFVKLAVAFFVVAVLPPVGPAPPVVIPTFVVAALPFVGLASLVVGAPPPVVACCFCCRLTCDGKITLFPAMTVELLMFRFIRNFLKFFKKLHVFWLLKDG